MKRCTICDKPFDLMDEQLGIVVDKVVPYGSVHDGERMKLHLCCDCFDKVVDLINPMCKHNIFSEVYDADTE